MHSPVGYRWLPDSEDLGFQQLAAEAAERVRSVVPTAGIPPPPPDLDCAGVPYTNFKVVGADAHHFDGDHDGIGCER